MYHSWLLRATRYGERSNNKVLREYERFEGQVYERCAFEGQRFIYPIFTDEFRHDGAFQQIRGDELQIIRKTMQSTGLKIF